MHWAYGAPGFTPEGDDELADLWRLLDTDEHGLYHMPSEAAVRVSIGIGETTFEVEDATGYNPDIMRDLTTRAIELALTLTTQEQRNKAAEQTDTDAD